MTVLAGFACSPIIEHRTDAVQITAANHTSSTVVSKCFLISLSTQHDMSVQRADIPFGTADSQYKIYRWREEADR